MKKTEKKHWYDSIIRPINGKKEDAKGNVPPQSSCPTIALPMIEEWASPENFAA